jgi:hypothetical protein
MIVNAEVNKVNMAKLPKKWSVESMSILFSSNQLEINAVKTLKAVFIA